MAAQIIPFPVDRPARSWSRADREAPPIVLILPSVRIERDEPAAPTLADCGAAWLDLWGFWL